MLKAVYALVGADTFLQEQKRAEVLKAAPSDAQRVEIDGERAELSQVLDEVRSFAMFGGHKVVTVSDAQAFVGRFREPVEKYLSAPVDCATLILQFDRLQKNSRIYRLIENLGGICLCEPPAALAQWIATQARERHGVVLGRNTAMLIAELAGADHGRLDGELAKLAPLRGGKRLSPCDLQGKAAFECEMELIGLTDALTSQNVGEAVRRWRRLCQIDPAGHSRACTWIAIWLAGIVKGLKLRRSGKGTYDICEAARVRNAELRDSFIQTMTAMGEEGAQKAIAQLAEIEYQDRSGTLDAAEGVERFLLSLKLS